jgi:NTE family protein
MSADLAIVLAGGGERAVAWELGVLAGLADAGLDARSAGLVVGTSAGALVGSHLARGISPVDAARAITSAQPGDVATLVIDAASAATSSAGDPALASEVPAGATNTEERVAVGAGPAVDATPIADAQEMFGAAVTAWLGAAGQSAAEQRRRVGAVAVTSRDDDERFVAGAARRLPPGGWPESLTLMAADADTGERVALRAGDGVPLERAVAASRAIPGLRPVVRAAGRRLMDGAVGSATNADVAAGAARVVIVTPTPPDPPPDTLFALWGAALEAELGILRAAGTDVVLVAAEAVDQEAMGADMLSGARAGEAFAAGRRSGAAALRPSRPRA